MKNALIPVHLRRLVITSLLSAVCSAQADLGFLPPDAPSIPPGVQSAANSVFRLINLGDKVMPLHTRKWATDYAASREVLDGNVAKGKLRPNEKALLEAQLNQCEQDKKTVGDCHLMFGFEYSSAFITGDGSELWTTFHSMRHYLHLLLKENLDDFSPENPIDKSQIAEAMRLLYSKNLPIVLSDRTGQVVFSSHSGDIARLSYIEPKALNFVWSAGWQSHYTLTDEDTKTIDYVRIKLSKPLGSGLAIDTSALAADTPLYIIGYPRETDNRGAHQAPDADGESQYATIGRRLSVSQLKERLRNSSTRWATGLDIERQIDRDGAIIAGDNDGIARMSGAPLLNKDGKVIGIYQSSTSESDDLKTKTTFSASFRHIAEKMLTPPKY